jgi:hypothetical protein
MENQVADFILNARKTATTVVRQETIKFHHFLKQISDNSFALIRKIMPYVLL